MRKINLILKRFIDFIGSLIGIIVLLPILIAISFAIKIDSKGPILFVQERLGKNGNFFKIFKFRTMIESSEKIGDGLFVYSDTDYRITKIGKILRKLSFDELPQLINVFIGQMSIVGPRPPVTYFPYVFHEYDENQRQRFKMRPGITGLAQVRTRTNAKWDERIIIDVEYVKKFNIFLDIRIILKTALLIFRKQNIYPESKEKIQNRMDEE